MIVPRWEIPQSETGVMSMSTAVQGRYHAHLDAKKRLTLRGAKYEYYEVREYDNGVILLEPRELVLPDNISKRTLQMMDESIRNLDAGNVSAPIDISEV